MSLVKYIFNPGINKENTQRRLAKDLKKEVEIGKNGTQKYVLKKGENKGKIL